MMRLLATRSNRQICDGLRYCTTPRRGLLSSHIAGPGVLRQRPRRSIPRLDAMCQMRTPMILIREQMRCVGGMTAMPETTDYDTIAGRYSAKIDERPWNALYERPTTLALLPTVNNIDVLDAGCGHGWYTDWLVRHGARVVAVDRSAAMVALAQKRVAGRARVIQGDVSNLRGILADETFDLVLSSLVLHYQADLSTVFAECARL